MNDFNTKRAEFLKKIGEFAEDENLAILDIEIRQIPKPGINFPDSVDSELVRKIMRVYNQVLN